jgi:protein-disulfide isomerase
MGSRERQTQRAREEREARAQEEALRERRTRRLGMLGVAAAAAAGIVVVAILISSVGGGDSKTGGQQTGAPAGAAEVNKRFAGIPQNGFALGAPKATVTLVEFADLQCPFCREAAVGSLPTLVDRYVRDGRVRIEFRNFAILGADSEKAARALAGAAAQDKGWQFLDLWYLNQGEENSGYVTDDFIRRIAGAVPGLDVQKVVAAANDDGNTDSLRVATTEAQKFGIDSTPSFLIGRTGGSLQPLQPNDAGDPAQFTGPIDALLGAR